MNNNAPPPPTTDPFYKRCGAAKPGAYGLVYAMALGSVAAHGQWLNVELPALDRDEIDAERTRQRTVETPSIDDAWDWTTMTQADLMREAMPVLAANADMCGHKVIRYRSELVCDYSHVEGAHMWHGRQPLYRQRK